MNELKKPSVVCESFLLEERNEAYIFVLNSLFEMSPTINRKNLHVIYGDEFITPTLLKKTGLEHVKIFHDHWHLFNNYEEELGTFLYRNVQPYIQKMMYSSSKEKYDNNLAEACDFFKDQGNVINLLNKISSKREFSATYVIDSTKGSCAQRGSTRAEQNHASIVAHLGKKYTGEFEELLMFLLNRQHHLSLLTNTELVKEVAKSTTRK